MYDLAVLDAFHGQRSLRWMEQFVQGGTMPMRTKGGQRMKRHNIPTIVCSNSDIEDCYPNKKPWEINILAVRFLVLEVLDFIDFYQNMEYVP